jgi:hypothetical protein
MYSSSHTNQMLLVRSGTCDLDDLYLHHIITLTGLCSTLYDYNYGGYLICTKESPHTKLPKAS